jgi:putative hydrolase of the HAD superfamily
LKIKAVLFDLGDTLVYQQSFEPFQKILRIHGIFKTLDEVQEAFKKAGGEFNVEDHLKLPSKEFYAEWNMTIMKHLGIDDPTRKLVSEIDRQWFNFSNIQAYPEVGRALRRLKKMKLKLGIITRGYETDIEQMLSRTNLTEFFDVHVGSDTTKNPKPHLEPFEYALKQLEITPKEAVFVGDQIDLDYSAAERAGLVPILIKRDGSVPPGVTSIRSLDEIFEILKRD